MTIRSDRRAAVARGVVLAFIALGLGAVGAGCQSRPVVAGEPETKANFTATVRQQVVEKVDILFAIDNSSSMGDKQELLAEAIPDLLQRLLTPSCVDATNPRLVRGQSQNGVCPAGTKLEFQPIRDLHVGVVSSALGTPGSETCSNNENQNDRGHLLTRTFSGKRLASVGPSGFMAWFPPSANNGDTRGPAPVAAVTNLNTLVADFQDLVRGVSESGCGYEAQMESWYRFLIQPDPYENVQVVARMSGNSRIEVAKLNGVDNVILQQRRDFLRPDSLVAIIQVTDENESTADPLSLGGQGWKMMDREKQPPLAARACDADPTSEDCGPTSNYDNSEPSNFSNIRFFQPKRRFGVDPFFPVKRYINGLGFDPSGTPLLVPKVPDRDGEHKITDSGVSPYLGNANCTNPLYAGSLPKSSSEELCKLPPGPRDPSLVFFATITGVPNQLLHFKPNDPEGSRLTPADWTRILGRDPLNYDFTGADPHMLESSKPRAQLAGVSNDPIHGREWDTKGNDLQYACTFDLKVKKNCQGDACDCREGIDSPVCDPNNNRIQVKAKAYPGIRHLVVAKALGEQGIVSSICPIDTKNPDPSNMTYGYRPAVSVIIDRLKNALATQCLPRRLEVKPDGQVPCLLLEVLGNKGSQSECSRPDLGLKQPEPEVLQRFLRSQEELHQDDGYDPNDYPVCELTNLTDPGGKSCATDQTRAGWCYTFGQAAQSSTEGRCSNAIVFTEKGNPRKGAKVYLQCIEKIDDLTKTAKSKSAKATE